MVVGEKRLIIRFKNRYLASNFHFIGNNTMLNEQVYGMGEWFGNKLSIESVLCDKNIFSLPGKKSLPFEDIFLRWP